MHAPGDRWSLRTELHGVLTAKQHANRTSVLGGELASNLLDRRVGLASEGASVRERRCGLAIGARPRCVGFEIARLGPRRLQRGGPIACRKLERIPGFKRGATPLDLAGAVACLVDCLANDPAVVGGSNRNECIVRRIVIGEAAASERDGRACRLCDAAFDLCPLRCSFAHRKIDARFVAKIPGLVDRLPTRASTQVRCKRLVDVVVGGVWFLRFEARESYHDARRAESALARTGCAERIRPAFLIARVEAVNGRDGTSLDAAGRCHARDTRLTVNEHGATTALALRAASILGRTAAEPIAECAEQRRSIVRNFDLATIELELDRRGLLRNGHGRSVVRSTRETRPDT